jgi:hypothetical protein
MKSFTRLASLLILLSSLSPTLGHAAAEIVTNDDESYLSLTGSVARELYNRLAMPAKNGEKSGKHIFCKLSGEDVFGCFVKLQEADGSGSKFTGAVLENAPQD